MYVIGYSYTKKALQQLKYIHMHIYNLDNISRKKLTGIMASNTNIAALPGGLVFSFYI